MNQQIISLFEKHPSKTEIFKTSDGYLFWERARAASHAATLNNKNVERIERPKSADDETAEVVSETKNYDKMNLNGLKAEAESRKLNTEGATTKVHFKALLLADDESKAAVESALQTPEVSDEEKAKVAIATEITEPSKA